MGFTEDVFSALDIQDELQTLYTSGTVFHAFLGEKLPDWKAAANLVRKIAENYKLPYYTMSPTYSVCRDHGYLTGEQFTCPICGKKTEVYSRITGYSRPVQNWNDGKVQEYKDRKVYNIGHSHLTHTGPLNVDGVRTEVPVKREYTIADAALEAATERSCCAPSEVYVMPEKTSARPDAAFVPVDIMDELPEQREEKAKEGAKIILFKTPTCPNCKAAMALLDRAGVHYAAVNANDEKDMAKKYGVRQAPTLVLASGESFEKYRGVSDIKGWLMHLS